MKFQILRNRKRKIQIGDDSTSITTYRFLIIIRQVLIIKCYLLNNTAKDLYQNFFETKDQTRDQTRFQIFISILSVTVQGSITSLVADLLCKDIINLAQLSARQQIVHGRRKLSPSKLSAYRLYSCISATQQPRSRVPLCATRRRIFPVFAHLTIERKYGIMQPLQSYL